MDARVALDRRAALALFAIFFALFVATANGLPDDPDAEVEFQTARSLVRDRSLALGDSPEARAIVAQRFDVAQGDGGRWYSWFGVGQALAATPFYCAGRALGALFPRIEARHEQSRSYGAARSEYFAHLAVGLRNPSCGALIAALAFVSARRLGVALRSAWLAAFALGATTFLWPQARATLSDVQATLCLAFAFDRWLLLGERARRGEPARLGDLAWLGAAAGFGALTRIALAPASFAIVAAAAASLVLRRERAASWLALAAPLAACATVFAAANLSRFGSPFATGYGAALSSGTFFSYPAHLGLAGVVLAPGKGLVWMASALAIAPCGWRALASRGFFFAALACALVAACVLAPFVATQAWTGGYTYGPRYALPLVPIAWLGVAAAIERARGLARLLLAIPFALGASVALAGVAVDHMTHEDLAARAARIAWPDALGASERERDDARFLAIQWDPRFAAPWAHWRILAHRLRGEPETFAARELFFLDSDATFEPGEEREKDFRHVAWIDLAERLGGTVWPVWTALGAILAAGIGLARGVLRADSRTGGLVRSS
jgi:hypothetical protein